MASARDTIYETLRSRLTSGYYPEDASLIPQVLSEEFQVSRTPVREALGLLERDGLLVSTQRGFALRRRSDEEMLEVFEARAILESSAAYAAARRRSPIDLARLDDVLARTRTESEPVGIRRCFNLWHEAVRLAAHNQTISGLLHTLDAQAKLSAPWKTPLANHTFDASIAEHEEMTEAIRTQDTERARTLMLEHQAHDRDTRILQLVSQMAQTAPGGHAASGHTTPGHLAPGHLAPGHLAPGHLAPDDLAPDDLAPDDLAPDDHAGRPCRTAQGSREFPAAQVLNFGTLRVIRWL